MDRQTDNCILRALVRKRKYQINHISLQGGVDGRGVNELEPNRQPPRVNYLSNIHTVYLHTNFKPNLLRFPGNSRSIALKPEANLNSNFIV